MLEIILHVLIELVLQPIGGFIRWVVYRKTSLKDYVNDDWEANTFTFIAFVAVIIIS